MSEILTSEERNCPICGRIFDQVIMESGLETVTVSGGLIPQEQQRTKVVQSVVYRCGMRRYRDCAWHNEGKPWQWRPWVYGTEAEKKCIEAQDILLGKMRSPNV